MFDLAPKSKVLVTGGAAGFGLAIAHRILETSDACVAIADIDKGRLDDAVRDLRQPERASGVQMDVRDRRSVEHAVDAAVAAMSGVDALVNSAGVCRITRFLDISEDEWDLILDTNLKGTFLVTKSAMPHLMKSGRGRVVNVSSAAGTRAAPLLAHYVSSKFGVVGLTQSLAQEFGLSGVRVNAVLPGSTPDTEMGKQLMARKIEMGLGATRDEVLAGAKTGNPAGRVGRIDDTVDAVMFLLSEQASWIYGHSLSVDGGTHMGGGPANPKWK